MSAADFPSERLGAEEDLEAYGAQRGLPCEVPRPTQILPPKLQALCSHGQLDCLNGRGHKLMRASVLVY